MTKLVLDGDKSNVRIRTFAEGLFARLAHDLELVCRGLEGSAERTEDGKSSASLTVPIGKIDVAGTLRDGRVDARGLSASDRADCLGKMRKDVFHTASSEDASVRIEATLADDRQARVHVVVPHGHAVDRWIPVQILDDGPTRVTGSFAISLDAIGAHPVKGPMNAFRVKDAVEILFELVFEKA